MRHRRSNFAYYSGTWIPVLIVVSIACTYLYARTEGLTWERPAVYIFAVLALCFGVQVLYRGIMDDEASGQQARFYPVALLWTGVAIALECLGLFFGSYAVVTGSHLVPESLSFSFIVAGVLSIGLLSFISFYGGKRKILDAPTDPIPFRSLVRWLRDRRRR